MSSAKNKRKRPYSHEVTHSKNTQRRLKTELKRVQKKLAKLLQLREDKKLRKNQSVTTKFQDKDGKWQTKKTKFSGVRYQGIAAGSERQKALQSYIQKLKNEAK